MNSDAKQLSDRLARTALQVVAEEFEGRILEYAWWNVTFEQVQKGIDPGWAEDNIGSYLTDAFGYSGSFIVDAQGGMLYLHRADEDLPATADKLWGSTFPQFLEAMHRTDTTAPKPVSGFVRVGSDISYVAAGSITPEDLTEDQREPWPRPVFVIHQVIGAAFLQEIGARYGLDNVAFSAVQVDGAGIALPSLFSPEPVGYLVWRQRAPGNELLSSVLPLAVGVVAVLFVAASAIYLLWLRAAVEANEAKAQILAKMSHEFRTPLNPILGFSEVMVHETMGPLSPRYRGYAEDINKSGKHLQNLVEELLDLSKIEAGKLELQDTVLNVGEIVGAVAQIAGGQAAVQGSGGPEGDAKARIVSTVDAGVPRLKADELRLRQVLINILSNATKFSDGTPIEVRVGANEGAVRIEVEDHGIGIPEGEIGRVLQPFEQATKLAPEKAVHGTGLGLAISRELMRLHGGDLTLQSEVGKGTCVTLTFPRTRSVAA